MIHRTAAGRKQALPTIKQDIRLPSAKRSGFYCTPAGTYSILFFKDVSDAVKQFSGNTNDGFHFRHS
jgi:hypothetical protein